MSLAALSRMRTGSWPGSSSVWRKSSPRNARSWRKNGPAERTCRRRISYRRASAIVPSSTDCSRSDGVLWRAANAAGSSGNQLADEEEKLFGGEGLLDAILGRNAQDQGFPAVRDGREHDSRNRREPGVLRDLRRELPSAHQRQHQIEKNEIGRIGVLQDQQRVGSVAGRHDAVSRLFQKHLDIAAQIEVVLDEKNRPLCHHS